MQRGWKRKRPGEGNFIAQSNEVVANNGHADSVSDDMDNTAWDCPGLS
jgi:hypothetical protein